MVYDCQLPDVVGICMSPIAPSPKLIVSVQVPVHPYDEMLETVPVNTTVKGAGPEVMDAAKESVGMPDAAAAAGDGFPATVTIAVVWCVPPASTIVYVPP